ncbi:MAG TPA: hypothetical protein DCO79_14025 [Spirochaeta sp.]|nr:hypothetical protein [Spirochaeta sp.]
MLIYVHDSSSKYHERALNWWLSKVHGKEQLGIPWVVALGFVRLLSNNKVTDNPQRPEILLDIISEILTLPTVKTVVPGMRHSGLMKELFIESGGTSRLTTDIHLAALAIELDAVLASNDVDFSRFSRLKQTNPLK